MDDKDKKRLRELYKDSSITPAEAVEQYLEEKRASEENSEATLWKKLSFFFYAFVIFLIVTGIIVLTGGNP